MQNSTKWKNLVYLKKKWSSYSIFCGLRHLLYVISIIILSSIIILYVWSSNGLHPRKNLHRFHQNYFVAFEYRYSKFWHSQDPPILNPMSLSSVEAVLWLSLCPSNMTFTVFIGVLLDFCLSDLNSAKEKAYSFLFLFNIEYQVPLKFNFISSIRGFGVLFKFYVLLFNSWPQSHKLRAAACSSCYFDQFKASRCSAHKV